MASLSVALSLAAKICLVTQFLCICSVVSTICFSGDSYKNASGHWNVEATVTHNDVGDRDPEFGLATRRWNYNVEVTSLSNGNGDSIQVVFRTTAPPRRVGSDYTLYPGFGYYKHHHTWTDWLAAKKICEKEGAHLIIIDSKEEVRIFEQMLKNVDKGQKWVHVGFHDRFREGEYTTVLGTPLNSTGYTEWGAGQPTGGDVENCGGANIATNDLRDVKCSDGAEFVCEQELW